MALRVVTFKLDEKLLEELDLLARERRMHRSELIRRAVKEFLARERAKTTSRPRRLQIWI